jgi:predicted DNA-binding transcriptional regulator AlpA
MDQKTIENLPQHLDFAAVRHIIGKSRHTIHRLVKDGTFDKIGRGRSARITLASVLRYLEQQRDIAVVASMAGTTVSKAKMLSLRKRKEDQFKRALELVNAGGAGKPMPDPTVEACVFEGVCMSVAERDAILDARFRASRPRRYTWANERGI